MTIIGFPFENIQRPFWYSPSLSRESDGKLLVTKETCHDCVKISLEFGQISFIKMKILHSFAPRLNLRKKTHNRRLKEYSWKEISPILQVYIQNEFGRLPGKCVSLFRGIFSRHSLTMSKRSDYSCPIRVTSFIERATCTKGVSILHYDRVSPSTLRSR